MASKTERSRRERVRVDVCGADELPPGTVRIVNAAGRRIGVFNVRGRYYALLDRCPHAGAPLCRGKVTGMTVAPAPGSPREWARDGEILRCPWHGWEFLISTGETVTKPTVRVKTFAVSLENDLVVIDL